jgi:uncharacterized membrane protein
MEHTIEPLVTNDAVVFGMLMILLAFVFKTSSSSQPGWKKFYKVVPMLLLCYFLPSILTTAGIIAPYWYDSAAITGFLQNRGIQVASDIEWSALSRVVSEHGISTGDLKPFIVESQLYFVASRYMLPASLVLLTLSIDLKEVFKLGPKALIMFFTGTVGIVIGGPLAIMITAMVSPETVGGAGVEAVWRGMTTIAGSWIGGGANQAAMYEIFKPSDSMYSIMITVDVLVAEVWMAFLLIGVGKTKAIDKWLKADSSAVTHLQETMHEFSQRIARIPSLADLMMILGVGLGATGLCHLLANAIAPAIQKHAPLLERFSLTSPFFWLIVLATTIGMSLSFTRMRKLEGAGASKIGSVFIYILVATIGMKMNVLKVFDNPGLFVVGGIWMLIHIGLLVLVAKLIRSPYFFLAVGSKANIGGAASAPVVAAAFHPSLAPVGVLLAVLGYALGTYGAWLCGILMQMVVP